METVSRSYGGGAGDDEDQALLERMAKREERRLRRMKEALERQRQQEPEGGESVAAEKNNAEEDRPSSRRRARYRDGEETEEKTDTYGTRSEEKEPEEAREEEEVAPAGGVEAEERGELEEERKEEADSSRGALPRDQVSLPLLEQSRSFYRNLEELTFKARYGALFTPRCASPSEALLACKSRREPSSQEARLSAEEVLVGTVTAPHTQAGWILLTAASGEMVSVRSAYSRWLEGQSGCCVFIL